MMAPDRAKTVLNEFLEQASHSRFLATRCKTELARAYFEAKAEKLEDRARSISDG